MSTPRPRFVLMLTMANLAIFSLLLIVGVLPSIVREVPDGYSDLSVRLGWFNLILYSAICVGAWKACAGKRYGRDVLLAGLVIFAIVVCFAQGSALAGTSAWSRSVAGDLALIAAWCILNCGLFLFARSAKIFYS